MADIGEPLRRVKIVPLTEPVPSREPEPERKIPAPTWEPAKQPERVDG